MFFVMIEVAIRYFGVLRRAIDAESRDLAIWTIPEAQKHIFVFLGGAGVGKSAHPKTNWAPSDPFGRLRYQGPPTRGASQGPRPLPAKPMTKGFTHPTMRTPRPPR